MKKSINHSEFSHPRLVSIFDTVNPIESYKDFYRDILYTLGVKSIIDFGCGTGLLTCELISPERIITGIDPYSELIEKAKERDENNRIKWVIGSKFDTIDDNSVDMILLSGHVMQFLLNKKDWKDFLNGSQRVLKQGGYVIFESRNPDIQPFQNWPTKENPKIFLESPEGKFSWWWEGGRWEKNIFSYSLFYHFENPDETIESPMSLIFRNKSEIVSSAQEVGFTLKNLFGDGNQCIFTSESEEMIFLFQK